MSSLQALKPESKEEPPELWAIIALTDPLIRKMHQHFAQSPQLNAINHPEWIFSIAVKIVKQFAPDTEALQSFLGIHQLGKMYHLPFEFARCIRSGVQVGFNKNRPAVLACQLQNTCLAMTRSVQIMPSSKEVWKIFSAKRESASGIFVLSGPVMH